MLVGKALSGGYMPVAAMVTTREIYQRAVGTLERCYVHQSTFGRNRLSMAAGLAAIRVIERDGLLENAARVGALLARGPAPSCSARHEMIKEIRARRPDDRDRARRARAGRVARVNWRLIHIASEGLFPQLVVIPLHRDHGVITMAAGKNDVIKLLPPLTLSDAEAAQLPRRRSTPCSPTARARRQELGRRARHRHRHAAPPLAPARAVSAERRRAAPATDRGGRA